MAIDVQAVKRLIDAAVERAKARWFSIVPGQWGVYRRDGAYLRAEDGEARCCVVGAVLEGTTTDHEMSYLSDAARELGVSTAFVNGIVCGFDALRGGGSDEYEAGYAVGDEYRKNLFNEFAK